MSYYWVEINLLIATYLLGTIPVGLVLSKIFHTPNPRSHGSGNIGTTNMLRTSGKKMAALTFLLDLLKGFVAIMLAYIFAPNLYQLAGIVVVIGHIFPIWLLFKGGKGVATGLGVIFAWDTKVAIACLMTWIALVGTTRYVSLGSIAAALMAPIASYILNDQEYLLSFVVLTLLILISHRDNIQRLLTGKELKLGESSTDDS